VAQSPFPAIVPLLRFSVRPKGLTATLQRFPLTKLAVHPAPGHVLESGWSHCSPELLRLSGLISLDMGRSAFLLPAPLTLLSPTSEDAGGWSPRGFLPAMPHLPSFEGCEPVWRSWPTASANPLECEPVATYFFSSKCPENLRFPNIFSEQPIPPRLTGMSTAFRPH
jgi:hypothetical protein